MLCFDVRLVEAKTVARIATDLAVPVRTNGRRGTDRAGTGLSNAMFPRFADRKPIGDLYQERLSVALGSDQRRSAATGTFLFLEKTAPDFGAKSGQSGAPRRTTTARTGAAAKAGATG